ncbi:basic helix-loop-helix (bHLH) DNA-binding superfamily protein [Abeliophyllum distichum]|uniref:Basic helix-loop-helix (BHLH) DNA-binding superfamily protein n=1 Tax=Abeliophyllum distichum TaxID=126358 RepID=A0ABD1PSB9_9LAMI
MERASSSSTPTPRIERRIIEKNRRNLLQNLYSKLHSLLPNHASKEALPLPDQLDEAMEYIKSLKTNLEKMKEMKKSLMPPKRSHSNCITSAVQAITESPLVEVHEMGKNMDVILLTGLESYSRFCGIIHLLHEDGVEVVNSNFSIYGNSTLQVRKADNHNFEATEMSRKLKEFICGTCSSDVKQQLRLWDYEIDYDNWSWEIINS